MRILVILLFTGFLAFCCVSLSAPAAASISAAEYGTILNLSGRQRMLTQKMSKEVVLVALNVDTEANLEALRATSALFNKTLIGLRVGSVELGLPPTNSRRILRQLDRVDQLWADFYPVVQEIISDGKASAEQVAQIASQNVPLLVQMNKTVGQYEKAAAASGLSSSPGLAVTLNLSGKQRMLSQKMSKEFLLVAYQHAVKDNQLNLLETFTLFDRTLSGLLDGDESLGLLATESADIRAQLNIVTGIWQDFKPVLEQVLMPQMRSVEDALIQQVAKQNMPLLIEMNKAVGMYAKLTAS